MPLGSQDVPAPHPDRVTTEAVFSELCDRKEMAFLVVPGLSGLSFDTKFLEHRPDGILVRAVMNRPMAQNVIQHKEVRLRFPWALDFCSASCRALEYLEDGKRHMLRLSHPKAIAPDEARRAFRASRVGHAQGVVCTPDMRQLVRVAAENLSLGGAGLFALEPLKGEAFQVGHKLRLDVNLEHGPRLEAEVRIVHAAGQVLGVAFLTPLAGPLLKDVQEWLAPREEEERRRWENRAVLRAQAEVAARPKAPPSGVLLVTRDGDLARDVAKALGRIQELRTGAPVVAEIQPLLEPQPLLVLLHVPQVTLEERFRLRAFAKSLPRRIPLVVLGTGEGAQAQALADELKSGAPLHWKPGTGNVLFQSLVQGVIRQSPAG